MGVVLSDSCRLDLLDILSKAPDGKRKTIFSSSKSTQLIYPIVYTRSIHDNYSVVYTEVSEYTRALEVYQKYSPRMVTGGKIIYYIDSQRQSVNMALHTISTDEFEMTYYSHFVVFTKQDAFYMTFEFVIDREPDSEPETIDLPVSPVSPVLSVSPVPQPLTLLHFLDVLNSY